MGLKADTPLTLQAGDLEDYMRVHHALFMKFNGKVYYLTDVNDTYWRAQATYTLNDKGHFTDCSDLVPLLSDFLALPWIDGKTVMDVFDESEFFESLPKDSAQ